MRSPLSFGQRKLNRQYTDASAPPHTRVCAGNQGLLDMNLSRLPNNLVVLVAEADARTRQHLETLFPSLPATGRIVRDGEEAVDYLTGHSPFLTRDLYPFPDLLIFNLHMPRMNGLELLRWVAHDSDCASLPKVVLDRTLSPLEILEAYRLGANTLFVRPNAIQALRETMQIIINYWGKAELPFVRHC